MGIQGGVGVGGEEREVEQGQGERERLCGVCERLREREIEGEIRDKERKGGREMSKSKKRC